MVRLSGLVATTLFAAACGDAVSPERPDPGDAHFAEVGPRPAIRGVGSIGTGTPTAGSDRQEFDFDVSSDLSGRMAYRDWRISATITVDSDPATMINAFREVSSLCANPADGAEFDGTGRLNTGAYASFTVVACDNGAAGSGTDGFMLTSGSYSDSGLLTSGDVVKTVTAPPPTTGDLTVNTATSGTGLPAGYRFNASGPGGSVTDTIGINSTRTFAGIPPGSYTVQLGDVPAHCTVSGSNPRTVTVAGGGAASTTFSVSCSAPNQAPTAAFTFSCSGLDCTFTSTSNDPDGTIATYRWTFGDGTSSTARNPSHSYASGGTYSVVLVVTDNRGATGTTSRNVTVVQPNRPPTVNAGGDESVLLGLSYAIYPSFSDPDHGPWSYSIQWGDGSTTNGTRSSQGKFSASHNYLLPGRYTIRVTVTDSRGLSGSDTKVVTVLGPEQ
jgi:PKD repeat protein